MKNCLGIEIGHYRIKIAYAENGELREFISERVEGIDRNDMRQYADLIKDLLKEYATAAGTSCLSSGRRMRMCGALSCR